GRGEANLLKLEGAIVVTSGDVPLVTADLLQALLDVHHAQGNAVTLVSAHVPDPTGYGRIVRDAAGAVTGIVEHKDATDEQRAITEINAGLYVFDAATLRDALGQLSTDNASGELYLTDVIAIARANGLSVGA